MASAEARSPPDGACWPARTAQAQNFPSRPLRLIVGYTAGGAVDIGEMLPATTEQPAAMLSSEKNRYEKLIREARIQPD